MSKPRHICSFVAVFLSLTAAAQTVLPLSESEMLCIQAEDKHMEYDFGGAVADYAQALALCRDSLRREEIARLLTASTNALQLSSYCSRPVVVAREKFSVRDFFLYYPMPDKSWFPTPNVLDSLSSYRFSEAVFAPAGLDEYFFSAQDTLGVRNIFEIHRADTLWSVPAALPFSSPESEAYPLLQGNRLFFSSRGLYGAGGYDLYVSERNPVTGEWSVPENLGFPYSSPADDFLFYNTPDGKYSLFASNRDCPPDSVNVYVLEYDPVPVRSPIEDPAALQALAALEPSSDLRAGSNRAALSEDRTAEGHASVYKGKMAEWRAVRDSIAVQNAALEGLRSEYAAAPEGQKEEIAAKIVAMESDIPRMQLRLEKTNAELRAIEMDFLLHGVVIDLSQAEKETDKEVVGAGSAYVFTRKEKGKDLKLQ